MSTDEIMESLAIIDASRQKLTTIDPECARDLADIIATVALSLATNPEEKPCQPVVRTP